MPRPDFHQQFDEGRHRLSPIEVQILTAFNQRAERTKALRRHRQQLRQVFRANFWRGALAMQFFGVLVGAMSVSLLPAWLFGVVLYASAFVSVFAAAIIKGIFR